MTWRIDDPQGNEAAKIRWELVEWTRGRVLDIGCGANKAFPHFIGVDDCSHCAIFQHSFRPDIIADCKDLSILASDSFDGVFSSHLLEHIERKYVVKTLREWLRVIKPGGFLCLYLPDETLYPKVGEQGSNPDHRWNVSYTLLVEMMKQTSVGWDLCDWQRRDQDNEYSLFTVFQKKEGTEHTFSCARRVLPEKTCAVVRYGATGDLVQASSVFAGLKKQGYHITVYTSPPQNQIILHDPNIDRFYMQDRDQVPNPALGEFWDYHARKYDKWVNLSESVERTLLALPKSTPHMTSPKARHRLMDINYLEYQHLIAGVPHVPQVRFYPTEDEKKWARAERKAIKGFCVVYALNGSSVHKRWPWMDRLISAALVDFPDINFVLVGGEDGQILEQGWFAWDKDPKHEDARKVQTEPRVHCRSGKWSIRQTLTFAQTADLVFGPETGVLNSVAQEQMPKVLLLSHSTVENLCRDWVNTHALASEDTHCPGRGKNEAPACHQMHYGWDFCKQVNFGEDAPEEFRGTPMGVSQCAYDLSFEEVYKVFWHAVTWEKKRKPALKAVG